jgi:hypothetical protein
MSEGAISIDSASTFACRFRGPLGIAHRPARLHITAHESTEDDAHALHGRRGGSLLPVQNCINLSNRWKLQSDQVASDYAIGRRSDSSSRLRRRIKSRRIMNSDPHAMTPLVVARFNTRAARSVNTLLPRRCRSAERRGGRGRGGGRRPGQGCAFGGEFGVATPRVTRPRCTSRLPSLRAHPHRQLVSGLRPVRPTRGLLRRGASGYASPGRQPPTATRPSLALLVKGLLARCCCPASMCAWSCGNAVAAGGWLIGWLLGRESTGLRKLELGL